MEDYANSAEITPAVVWTTWGQTRSIRKAATALGIARSTAEVLIQRHRDAEGLPKSARPPMRDLDAEAYAVWVACGKSLTAAAEQLGLSHSGVSRRVKRHIEDKGLGVETDTRPSVSDADAEQAWEAWRVHGNYRVAAKALGLTEHHMRHRLRKYRRAHGLSRTAKPEGWRKVSPRRVEPVSVEAAQAWEAVAVHGTVAAAQKALGLSQRQMRTLMRAYRQTHGYSAQATPQSVTGPARVWEAWGRLGTLEAAAIELGVSQQTACNWSQKHRQANGLPVTARPEGIEHNRGGDQKTEEGKRAAKEAELDHLLAKLERARSAERRSEIRREMHAIERELYGWGME